jgi:hypothetical protein
LYSKFSMSRKPASTAICAQPVLGSTGFEVYRGAGRFSVCRASIAIIGFNYGAAQLKLAASSTLPVPL